MSRRWPHEERWGVCSEQLEKLVQKRALNMHGAHVWLIVTKCSPHASFGPHPTPAEGQPRWKRPVQTPLGAEGRRAAKYINGHYGGVGRAPRMTLWPWFS